MLDFAQSVALLCPTDALEYAIRKDLPEGWDGRIIEDPDSLCISRTSANGNEVGTTANLLELGWRRKQASLEERNPIKGCQFVPGCLRERAWNGPPRNWVQVLCYVPMVGLKLLFNPEGPVVPKEAAVVAERVDASKETLVQVTTDRRGGMGPAKDPPKAQWYWPASGRWRGSHV